MKKVDVNDKKNIVLFVIGGLLLVILLSLMMSTCSHSGDVYNVETYGAVGDGKTDSTASVQKAIDDCSANSGGQVYFPPSKTFITGPVELKSNIDVHLSPNAVWKASDDYTRFTMSAFRQNTTEGNK